MRIGATKLAIFVALLALAASACGTETTSPRSPSGRFIPASPQESALAPPPPARPTPTVGTFLPSPFARLSTNPPSLAAELVKVTRALRASIEEWIAKGVPSSGGPPQAVVLQGLYQQRIYRLLAGRRTLARITIARLPRWLVGEARDNVTAAAELFSLVTPIAKPSQFKTAPPKPAGVLLRYYRKAERRFGVDWEVLAALNYVESKFGRVVSASTAGAQGPMQFLPSTWAVYGLGGDIHDPRDAVLAAANYLRHSGAPDDYRAALYAYNHSWAYVDAILRYARQMRGDRRDYFAYYSWQVFVLTTKGDRRITGPGL